MDFVNTRNTHSFSTKRCTRGESSLWFAMSKNGTIAFMNTAGDAV